MSSDANDELVVEGRRCHALLDLLLGAVPEIEEWWVASMWGDDDSEMVLWRVQGVLIDHLIEWPTRPARRGGTPPRRLIRPGPLPPDATPGRLLQVNTIWPRVLQVVEVALHVVAILEIDPAREDDSILVHGFAAAGIVHDLTRYPDWVETLVPWMGPLTVNSAREEIATCRAGHYTVDEVNWSGASSSFELLDVNPHDFLPSPPPRVHGTG